MEWIKCEDRLPILETDKFKDYESFEVIVYDGHRVFSCDVGAGRAHKFWCEFILDGMNGYQKHITHWMPLPEPPKETE